MAYPDGVTDADLGRMMKLSKYLRPGASYLSYKGNKAVVAMDIGRIGEVLGVGESQTKLFIKRVTDAGMMTRQDKRYYFNPAYFLNGRYVSDELYWLFAQQLNQVFPPWVQKDYADRRGGRP